jgi:hypothetical protein
MVRRVEPRSYPVLNCPSCGHVTGWLASDGRCADCLEPERRRALFESGVFATAPLEVPLPRLPVAPPLARAAAAFGLRGARERAAARTWLALVDPGTTGPVQPTDGFEIEAAVRSEVPAPEGPHLLVRFQVVSLRFEHGTWLPIDGRRVGKPRLQTPATFSASLPMKALAEAWADYRGEVDAFNRAVWASQAARIEDARTAATDAEDVHRREQGTSDLLP